MKFLINGGYKKIQIIGAVASVLGFLWQIGCKVLG